MNQVGSNEHLADGGFNSMADIEQLAAHHTVVYSPVKAVKNKFKKGIDPYAPSKGDSETIAQWRQRMGTEAGQAIYKLRASIAEFPNAVFRNNGLQQFGDRGEQRVKSATLWHVLAFDISRILSLDWLSDRESAALNSYGRSIPGCAPPPQKKMRKATRFWNLVVRF